MAQNQQRDNPESGNPLKVVSGVSGIFRKYGPYLDKHWHTRPWLTVVGAVLGIITGFYNFFRTVAELNKKEKEEENGR